MRYLLNTNILSDLIRNPQGKIAGQIRKRGEAQVVTSIIVAAELRYGAAKKLSARLSDQVEAVLGAIDILPFEEPADQAYATLRVQQEKKGQLVGGNDMLIAAQAIAMGLTLVTDNEREFSRVKGLLCENWLR
jgi:tRNA(fMet)-specific endonuclease VapC